MARNCFYVVLLLIFTAGCSGIGNSSRSSDDGSGSSTGDTQSVVVHVCDKATLRWKNPSKRVDGQPLTNMAGNNIYMGVASGAYSTQIVYSNTSVGTKMSYLIQSLAPNMTYYFTITAFAADGSEGAKIKEVIVMTGFCAKKKPVVNLPQS